MRGFACIGLHNPKNSVNIGSVLRLSHNFDTSLIAVCGKRYQRSSTDTLKSYRHRPLIETKDLFDVIPFDCVPVAIDCGDFPTIDLCDYSHPERAFYIFGSEDNGLPKEVMHKCRDVVSIKTDRSTNLSHAVAIVLYDRMLKSRKAKS